MSNVLTTASIIKCDPSAQHGGTVGITSNSKLRVDGNPVLMKNSIGPSISGCKQQSSTTSPCSTVTNITVGEAMKLRVGASPVMLDTLAGTTNGNPVGKPTAVANQTKLTAS